MSDSTIHARPNSDNEIRVTDIESAFDQLSPDSVVSVAASILDTAGTPITGSSISLSGIDSSADLEYTGVFPSTITLTNGTRYLVRVIIVAMFDAEQRTGEIILPFIPSRSNPRSIPL